jgi:NAD-dependent dihydropyrimidine dehydrogenase PreA subunit
VLFRILPKPELERLVTDLLGREEVVGPRRVGTGRDGRPLHRFVPVTSFAELDLGYEGTDYSAKTYFLPFRETLSTFRFADGDFTQTIRYRVEPRTLFGLHACDIAALVKLDRVLGQGSFPSPYYVSRRRNTPVVGLDHDPCKDGFCRAVGADTVERGFHLFLTDLGERYFVTIGSDRGYDLVGRVQSAAVNEADRRDFLAVRRRLAGAPRVEVRAGDLGRVLDLEFDSSVRKKWGERCLSCGSCAMVCPTCYCYGICEQVSMDFREARKVRQLHGCTLADFAVVAGGHNFRPDPASRLKYRYYHQHRGFREEPEGQCVGCNRCGRACLAGIAPRDVIRDVWAEEPV